MQLRRCRQFTAVFAAISTIGTTLADPVDPLQYSEVIRFFPSLQKDVICPANFYSCENQGAVFAGACCENGQICSLDAHKMAACCPTTATCTGVAPGIQPTATPSYVSNPYFAFPIIPTSFSNPAACTVALRACSQNYDACLVGLTGGNIGYGVTIQVPGVPGTTVTQVQAVLPSASATAVCSTLSLEGCHGLSNGLCHAGTQGGFTVGSANGAPRPTAACMLGVMAGVGLGIAGGNL